MMRSFALVAALLGVAAPLAAQADHQHSPYAGRQPSGIASLSLAELEELRSGAGMGQALAAEVNGYPGPRHVLDLADSLALTTDQRTEVAAIFERMQAEARALGERVIDAERTLSQRFEHAHIDATTVRQMTAAIGALRGELRAIHLIAHLEVTALLTVAQVAAYDRLRGYEPAARR